jgi:hypothetical protein
VASRLHLFPGPIAALVSEISAGVAGAKLS